MTTAELERRLVVALRSADSVPVDVAAARVTVLRRDADLPRVPRRRLVAALAAAVVAVSLAVALVARLVDPDPQAPPAREITVSPSGLPVGELHGKVMLTNEVGVWLSLVVIAVRPDGTGSYGRSDLGDAAPYDVTIRPDPQGRAVLGYAGPLCADPQALTLEFTVQAHEVTVIEAIPGPGGCVVTAVDAAAFRGVTFDVRPLPAG